VLLVQDSFLPDIGGAEIHVANLARALRSRGHQVSVATATPGPAEWESVPVHRFPGLQGGGRQAIVRLPVALPRLAGLIWRHDVVHCHFSFFLAAVCALTPRPGRPLVVSLHGLGTLDSSVAGRAHLEAYRWISLKGATRVVATSPELAAVACRFTAAERVVFIPNGVDTEVVDHGGPSVGDGEPARVVAVRRLEPKNGVQYLIEAVPELVRRLDGQVQVVIAGDGSLGPWLRERVAALGVDNHVVFLGQLDNDAALAVMDAATVVVFPSSAESTSIAALEAMARGKPVVASAVGAFPELIGDERGVLVRLFDRTSSDYNAPATLPPARLSALAAAVARVVAQPELAERLGRQAQDYVRRVHDWRVIAGAVERCYYDALDHGRAG
jgi:glycosyltransferase involved in cell wall biosynthesis